MPGVRLAAAALALEPVRERRRLRARRRKVAGVLLAGAVGPGAVVGQVVAAPLPDAAVHVVSARGSSRSTGARSMRCTAQSSPTTWTSTAIRSSLSRHPVRRPARSSRPARPPGNSAATARAGTTAGHAVTHTAVVSFAPAYDTRHVTDDRAGAPDLMVGSDALKKVRLDEPVPVVVDHNREHVVGQVRNFWVHEDVDLGTRCRRWWFASCHLTEAPSWLKRGGGVSWSYNLLSAYDLDGISIITSCLFREVSLLTPATQPAEPLACVMLLKREAARTSAPAVGPDRLAADEIIDGGILRRPATAACWRCGDGSSARARGGRPNPCGEIRPTTKAP